MKRIALTFALAIAFTIPLASLLYADPLYRVLNNDTKVWQHSFARGNVRCTLNQDQLVYRSWGDNWDRWIYVTHTKWSTSYNYESLGCEGWIDKHNIHQAWTSIWVCVQPGNNDINCPH